MLKQVIDDYRAARDAMLAAVPKSLVPGARVKIAGVKSDNWNATVMKVDGPDLRSTPADMVWLKFDDGNRFPVAIDELELIGHSKGTGDGSLE